MVHQVKAGSVVKSITIQDQVDQLKQAVEYLKANTLTKADMDGSLNSLVHAVVAQLKPAPVQPPVIVAPKPEEVKAVCSASIRNGTWRQLELPVHPTAFGCASAWRSLRVFALRRPRLDSSRPASGRE